MQCPSCATPAPEGQSQCAQCGTPLTALAGAYAAPHPSTDVTIQLDPSMRPAAKAPAIAPVEAPGESTQWWTPEHEPSPPEPSQAEAQSWQAQPPSPQASQPFHGSQHLAPPAHQGWTGPPQSFDAAPAPVVPDTWFAAPISEQAAPWENAAPPEPTPWESAPREEKPLWDPNGPLPMTNSHRGASSGGGAKNKFLLFGVGALVLLSIIAVILVMLPGDDEEPKRPVANPTTTSQSQRKTDPAAQQQAAKVNALLNQSGKSRALLSTGLVNGRSCDKLPLAIADMEKVSQQRTAQLQQAQQLRIPALANAQALRSSLAKSIKLSLDVDVALLRWARAHQGCTGKTPSDKNYKLAMQLSGQASRAKAQFLSSWNKVAPKYGFSKRKNF